MPKKLDDLKRSNMKTDLPDEKKNNKTKAIRINEENYEYLRIEAFKNKTTIKDLADKIIEKEINK